MIAIALRNCSGTLVFWGDFTLSYVANKVLLFFLPQLLYQQNDSTKHDYNLEGFSQYKYKYMFLTICSLKYFEQCMYMYSY